MRRWKQRVDVGDLFHDDDLPLPDKGAAIARRLRTLRIEGDDLVFDETLEELGDAANADDVEWFDAVWNGVYDWADGQRVWIETWRHE